MEVEEESERDEGVSTSSVPAARRQVGLQGPYSIERPTPYLHAMHGSCKKTGARAESDDRLLRRRRH
jgi:hypothetical protein